jgi:hypothetical protein
MYALSSNLIWCSYSLPEGLSLVACFASKLMDLSHNK